MIDQTRRGRSMQRLSSIRVRVVTTFVVVLGLATLASVWVDRVVLLGRLDDRIDRDLGQEAAELRRLASGNDPDTGEPFGRDVERIFEVFLERNIPGRNEAMITFVDGKPFLRSRRVAPYRLDRDPEAIRRWSDLERTDRGVIETPEGSVEYLAVPVRAGKGTEGVFVGAIFRDLERAEIDPAIMGAAGVGIVVLGLGSVMALRLADRILRPVRSVHDAARSISETDLRRRIDVQGHDEIAQLATTFNDMLDRLERAFGAQRRFLDDVSHELRTPITIVRGQLETLGNDPEDRKKTLDIVMDELDRMARFVSDLLLLARADRPDFLELDTVDVESLTEELYAKAGTLAPRGWVIDETGRGRIVADRQRLTQAVIQLAENAARHTDTGAVIGVGSRVVNGEARFWVRDSGPGIAQEDHERVFDRLWTRRPGRGREGAGLGLSIVDAIAKAHRGRVQLDSRPGEGATFTISVPVEGPRSDGRIST
jgi:signal transduction histidine kinase